MNRITCDQCGEDITTTGKMPAYRLRLSCEALPYTSSSVYAVHVSPPLPEGRVHHFCSRVCLMRFMVALLSKGEVREINRHD